MGVFRHLQEHAESTQDPWLHFGDERLSRGDVADRALQLATGLWRAGIGKGDRVALMLPNCVEFVLAWMALARMGGVMVPINPASKGDGLAYVLEHSGARIVIADTTSIIDLEPVLSKLTPSPDLVMRQPHSGAMEFAALLDEAAGSLPPEPGDDALLSILYTSGTTGPPKGVMTSHRSYARAGREFIDRTVGCRADDVFLTTLPLFHINAQQLTTMGSMLANRPMWLIDRFSASAFWDQIRNAGATIFNYIGAMLAMLLKQPPRDDDAENPARLTFGGGALPDVWVEFERRFGVTIVEGYGLTETATVCMTNPLADIRVGTIGKPVSWAEAKIVDENDQPTSESVPGEIVIRSTEPGVLTRGYYRMAEQTEAAMRGGWFHTGDRGVRIRDGYFRFLDRMKDSIRRRGENISSFEVEWAVNKHPSVVESAAVGAPSELGEEEVRIVVVLRPGAELSPEDLLDHCSDELPVHMVPRYVEFRSELPKTPTQRVQKFALRAEGAGSSWDREAHGYVLRRRAPA